MLKEGDKIPGDIALISTEKKAIKLNSFVAKYLLIYFYPADDTPGCTTEACSFRDINEKLKAMGVEVIGISKDEPESHQKFKKKYQLNFTLLSDPEHKLIERFGAWGKKVNFGHQSEGTLRSTFLIGPQRTVLKVWRQVKPEQHAQEVLEFLKSLRNE